MHWCKIFLQELVKVGWVHTMGDIHSWRFLMKSRFWFETLASKNLRRFILIIRKDPLFNSITCNFHRICNSRLNLLHGEDQCSFFNISKFHRMGEYLGETRYPPYEEWKINRLNFLVKNRKMPSVMKLLSYLLTFFLGAGSVFLLKYLKETMEM